MQLQRGFAESRLALLLHTSFGRPVGLDAAGGLPGSGRVCRQRDRVRARLQTIGHGQKAVFIEDRSQDFGAEVGRNCETAVGTSAFIAIGRYRSITQTGVHVATTLGRLANCIGEFAEVTEAIGAASSSRRLSRNRARGATRSRIARPLPSGIVRLVDSVRIVVGIGLTATRSSQHRILGVDAIAQFDLALEVVELVGQTFDFGLLLVGQIAAFAFRPGQNSLGRFHQRLLTIAMRINGRVGRAIGKHAEAVGKCANGQHGQDAGRHREVLTHVYTPKKMARRSEPLAVAGWPPHCRHRASRISM